MSPEPLFGGDETIIGLGTQLRRLLDVLERDVAALVSELGLTGYRPRYTPVVRALLAGGPMPIRDLARALGVTHSAASQTVAAMTGRSLLRTEPGDDGRQRVVHLTPAARELLPALDTEWRVTEAAAADLDAELPMPLRDLLTLAEEALARRSLRDRMVVAAHLTDPRQPGDRP